jgi:hypothetical protein
MRKSTTTTTASAAATTTTTAITVIRTPTQLRAGIDQSVERLGYGLDDRGLGVRFSVGTMGTWAV